LNTFTIPYKEVLSILPLPLNINNLTEYLNGGRQDVLDNVDIFTENVRSRGLCEKDFSLFTASKDLLDYSVVVFPIYLELFQFENITQNIGFVIDHYCSKYPNNDVVFFWNHDVDFSIYNSLISKYKNCVIINYNTSSKSSNDIVVPFWTMNDISPIYLKKEVFACFFGSLNHNTRLSLARSIQNKDGYIYGSNLSYKDYRNALASSIFGLCPRGVGLSSYRFFECIHTNTIPVLFADSVVLPYSEELDYSKLIVRIPENKASDFNYIDDVLKNTDYNNFLTNLSSERSKFSLLGVQKHVHSFLSIRR
jgi:hypothetical protein